MAGQLDPKTGLLTQAPTGSTIDASGVVTRTPINAGLNQPDLRSVISSTPQAGYIQGYDTNNNYASVYVPKGQYVPGISLTPKQMTTDSLNQSGNVKIPGSTDQPSEAPAIIGGAGATVDSITQQLTPTETPEEAKNQSILNDLASLTAEFQNKGADQLSAEQAQGIPELKTQLLDVNNQIKTKLAEYNALETQNKNRPVTMDSIIGSQRAILDAKASDIGLLQAQAQGLQGNLALAQETANRAVDVKYSGIEARLNTYQAQLNALKPTLDKQERTQALAQQVLLDQQKQEIADKKETEKNIQGLVLEAASQGASSQVLSAISGAKTLTEASQVYSSLVRAQQVSVGGTSGGGVTGGTPTAKEIAATAQAAAASSQAQAQVTLADNILSSSGFSGAVGPNRFARFRPIASLTGSTADFIASVEQLTNQQTLKTLTDLKKAGGTLGALSEKELTLLQDSATKINNWALRDKNGKVYAYKASEKDFKAEINRIKDLAQKAITNATVDENDPLNLGINQDPLGVF